MLKNNLSKGFTLIELLVVISIIGLLSTVVLAALNSARAKGRDALRLSDMHQLDTALALYYDKNGSYPPAFSDPALRENSCNANPGPSAGGVIAGKWWSSLNTLVTSGFISKLPVDPKQSSWSDLNADITDNPDYCYTYITGGVQIDDYNDCKDIQTGTVYNIRDYNYAIYFSTEVPPTKGLVANWNGGTAPMNRCILGPKR